MGFGQGTYILIDASGLQGSLGADLDGTIGDLPAYLSISGNDLILSVVPEPAGIELLAVCFLSMLTWKVYNRRRHLPGFHI